MPSELTATIEAGNATLHGGDPIWIRLVVVNREETSVSVANPDVGRPPDELDWTHARETFQTAVLLSVGLLEISVTGPTGESVPQSGPQPWVNPLLMPRLELAPGEALSLRINLGDHFDLRQAGRYRLTIKYGDDVAFARAETDLRLQ